ncbi:MAG: hypothetical protein WA802_12295 [Terracidiphilus sp.]
MNAMRGTTLGLAVALATLATSAQENRIPLKQIEMDAQNLQLLATAAAPDNEAAAEHANGMLSGTSSSSGGFVLPAPAVKLPRTLSPGFFLLNGAHLGLAVFDVEMTQHCLADHHCVEGNPLMPSSRAGQLGLNFALFGYGSFMSYRLKRQERRLWMLSPVVGIVAHTVGVATGFAHR